MSFTLQNPLSYPRRKLQSERSAESLPICQRCKEVFFKKQIYMRHVAESSCTIQEYDFKCNICPMSFMNTEELQKHKHLHRADKFFCHKYCGKYFDTIAECESHEYMQHEYESFVCNVRAARDSYCILLYIVPLLFADVLGYIRHTGAALCALATAQIPATFRLSHLPVMVSNGIRAARASSGGALFLWQVLRRRTDHTGASAAAAAARTATASAERQLQVAGLSHGHHGK